jgi:hypothetical protein
MSHCPYCRCELAGFETLCKTCFEAGYDQVVHPKSWWQRGRIFRHWPRVTRDSVYGFLFLFAILFLRVRFDPVYAWTTRNSALLALVAAFFAALTESTIES